MLSYSNASSNEEKVSMPKTQWTSIKKANHEKTFIRKKALEEFAILYWKPIYHHIRRKWPHIGSETARDLTQHFLTICTERVIFRKKNVLSQADPVLGKFRTYLARCVDNFVISYFNYMKAKGRSPEKAEVSIDNLKLELPNSDSFNREDTCFNQNSYLKDFNTDSDVTMLCLQTLESLEKWAGSEKNIYFDLFIKCIVMPSFTDQKKPNYSNLAHQYGLGDAKNVSNKLITARRAFQRLLRENAAKSGFSKNEIKNIIHRTSRLSVKE